MIKSHVRDAREKKPQFFDDIFVCLFMICLFTVEDWCKDVFRKIYKKPRLKNGFQKKKNYNKDFVLYCFQQEKLKNEC